MIRSINYSLLFSWADIINGSIEITSRFCFKVYTGHNIMPDFMDYDSLRAYFMGRPMPKPKDTSLKVKKFYPNIRLTEISDIEDINGAKNDELLEIFDAYGRLWKAVNLHEVKLQDVAKFGELFERLVNVTKMKFLNCEVAEDLDEEVMLAGKPLPSLKDLEVTKVDWRLFKVLKHCRKIAILKLTQIKISQTNDFNDFLLASENLKELELYSKAKDSFDTALNYKFKLESLNIDRSDLYTARSEVTSCCYSKFEDFVSGQRKSLKCLKFKGKINEKEIVRLAKEMKLKEINFNFVGDGEPLRSENPVKNRELETLMIVGAFVDVQMMLKYFTGN